MWGCFYMTKEEQIEAYVFPTHVGVFPLQSVQGRNVQGLPHACGGVSLRV